MIDVASVRVILTALTSWLNRQQQDAIAYAIEEIGSSADNWVDGASG